MFGVIIKIVRHAAIYGSILGIFVGTVCISGLITGSDVFMRAGDQVISADTLEGSIFIALLSLFILILSFGNLSFAFGPKMQSGNCTEGDREPGAVGNEGHRGAD